MYATIFGKDNGEFTRYWISVSTEKYDSKKKKGTGEYVNASISARLSSDMQEVFEAEAVKTKSKKISMLKLKNVEGLFEAVEPKDGEPYVRFVVLDGDVVQEADD